ncbi:MAG: alpha,alpha-trehalose-phosphate synthase (UDP-forming) [Actinomycetota bacterium]
MDRPVIVASNRGPVTFERTSDGSPSQRRGVGGLVTAVSGALRGRAGTWIASAVSDEDRVVAVSGPVDVDLEGATLHLRMVDIPPAVYGASVDGFCNRILWFVHHYLWDPPRTPTFGDEENEAWEAYQDYNRRFAEVAAEAAPEGGVALIQDYHLALAPALLRKLRPDLAIGLFWHIPFAQPDYLSLLSDEWTRALLDGMLGADVVGFQTERWLRNFLAGTRQILGIKARDRILPIEGRTVRTNTYPIGVNPEHLAEIAAEPAVRRARAELKTWLGDRRLVLRVDRTELSKNILRGLRAYELMLERRPELRGRVVHLALLQPSRRSVPEYQEYIEQCVAAAGRVNERFGPEAVRLEISDNFPRTLAAYGMYDVLVVNPVFDGMNLVAREGPCLNRRAGVLVLSRNAGASVELAPASLLVNPVDIDQTSRAISDALDMPEVERQERARRLRRLARGRSPGRWLDGQLRDLTKR